MNLGLRATGIEPQSTSYKLEVTSLGLRVLGFRATGFELWS